MNGVIYIACTNVGRSIIQANLKNHLNIPILAVINLDYDVALQKANFDSLDDICVENKIKLLRCKDINDEFILHKIKELSPDLIIQSGWSQKFSNDLLKIPRFGCIGEHPSPLPIGRGAACVNWAILEGQKNWGDSFFRMTSVYDVGDVLSVDKFDLGCNDTCKTVYDKVAISAYKTITNYLPSWIEGSFSPIVLDESIATYYKKRRPEDGFFSFEESAASIVRKINALTRPYPGARFMYKNTVIFAWKASFLKKDQEKLEPGSVITLPNSNIAIVCADGNLVILEEISSTLVPPCSPMIFFELLLGSSHRDLYKYGLNN